ncbi:hypothetical protein [Chryseobacterium oryctis]|uniref:Uncharacterized protein n=1 Tax=Chryseobacterium oryctis TaxID=2952618 RepID=A0ABT3HS66_9FLAO|nr:hypothetical protein [Chryseobacterium oryctis]MCW3162584.1 hypothetical protein [Chryseobacterium oryctis]
MKKIFYSLLLFASVTLFAQKNPTTRFAVANDVIGTVDMFNAKKSIVQSSNVYKTSANLPQNLKKYSSIAEKGLTEYKIKNGFDGLDKITLAQLNEQYQLPNNTPVFIDGYEFSNTETKVFGDILAKMEVKDNNGKKSLFISTLR